MNPKRCMKCLVHGDNLFHPSVKCPKIDCKCPKCDLLDRRRAVVRKLVRLGRQQKIDLGIVDTNGINVRYTCARCRHHGVVAVKKFHTPCPYSLCKCKSCDLNEERRIIDNELTAVLRNEKVTNFAHLGNEDAEMCKIYSVDDYRDQRGERGIILDLITLLTLDADAFNPEAVDYEAISNLFSQPTIKVPAEWVPHMDEISELVFESLKRLPRYKDVDFGANKLI